MKSFFFTFALLLTGVTAFANDTTVEPLVDAECTEISGDVDFFVIDDQICYSTSVTLQASVGFLSAGATITVSGCGNTAAEAWANFQSAMNLYQQQ